MLFLTAFFVKILLKALLYRKELKRENATLYADLLGHKGSQSTRFVLLRLL